MITIPSPYPGLRPFEKEDWPIFFGRSDQTNQLVFKLERSRFVAVVGSSGSGKSSLVKAGLLPRLDMGFLRDIKRWTVLQCRPGNDPFGALAAEFLAKTNPGASGGTSSAVEKSLVAAEMRRSNDGIVPLLESLSLEPSRHFLIVVDQFEELFTFRKNTEPLKRGEAERFVQFLLKCRAAPIEDLEPSEDSDGTVQGCEGMTTGASTLSEGPASPRSVVAETETELSKRIWVVITMRSDFIGQCEIFPELARFIADSQFLVPVLDSSQKLDAIERPGRVGNSQWKCGLLEWETKYPKFTLAPGLASMIVNETGDRQDQLPLMQHALMRAWKESRRRGASEVTLTDYQETGGLEGLLENDEIEGALSRDATRALNSLAEKNPRLRDLASRLFLLLCDFSDDGQITRRRPLVRSVLEATGATLNELEEVLLAFQDDDRNFLLPLVSANGPKHLELEDTLDISHEALLRKWQKCREWRKEETARVEELKHLNRRSQKEKHLSEKVLEGYPNLLDRQWSNNVLKASWKPGVTQKWAERYLPSIDWGNFEKILRESENKATQERAALEAQKERQEAQDRNQKFIFKVAYVIITAAILGAGVWVKIKNDDANQRIKNAEAKTKEAERKTAAAEKATKLEEQARQNAVLDREAVRFTSNIGIVDFQEEIKALWELATFPSPDVRTNVIRMWMQTKPKAKLALLNEGAGLRAAVGTSAKMQQAASLGLWTLVTNAGGVLDGDTWRGIAATADPQLQIRVGQFAGEMVANSSKGYESLEGLRVVAESISGDSALTVLSNLISAIESPGNSNGLNWYRLMGPLRSLSDRIPKDSVAPVAERTVSILTKFSESDSAKGEAMAYLLDVLARSLSEQESTILAQKLMSSIESVGTNRLAQTFFLAGGVGSLIGKTDATVRGTIANKTVRALFPILTDPAVDSEEWDYIDFDSTDVFSRILRFVSPAIRYPEAIAIADKLVSAKKQLTFNSINLVQLCALLPHLPEAVETKYALQASRSLEPDSFRYDPILTNITIRLGELELAQMVADSMFPSKRVTLVGNQNSELDEYLLTAAERLSSGNASNLVVRFLANLSSNRAESVPIYPKTISALARRTDPAIALKACSEMVEQLKQANLSTRPQSLLLRVFEGAASQLRVPDALRLAGDILKTMLSDSVTTSGSVPFQELKALAAFIPQSELQSFTQEISTFLLSSDQTNVYRLRSFGLAFQDFSKRLQIEERERLSKSFRAALLTETSLARLASLADVAAVTSGTTNIFATEELKKGAYRLLDAMAAEKSDGLNPYSSEVTALNSGIVSLLSLINALPAGERGAVASATVAVMPRVFPKGKGEGSNAADNAVARFIPFLPESEVSVYANRRFNEWKDSNPVSETVLNAIVDRVGLMEAEGVGAFLANRLSNAKTSMEHETFSAPLAALAARGPWPDCFEMTNYYKLSLAGLLQNGIAERRFGSDRRVVTNLMARLSPEAIVEVLKWPFCVGESQQIALSTLAQKLDASGKKTAPFDGNLWNFVAQGPALGFTNLDQPPIQPVVPPAPIDRRAIQLAPPKNLRLNVLE